MAASPPSGDGKRVLLEASQGVGEFGVEGVAAVVERHLAKSLVIIPPK